MNARATWPELPYESWQPTLDTLHMYAQVVGKLRLALSPFEPQWANVALYPTARGLGTSAVPDGLRTFDAELDFVDHQLVLRTSAGGLERLPLQSQAVADFYADVTAALTRLGIEVSISTMPSEVPDPIPFPDDRVHHAYDARSVERFWRILSNVAVVMNRHRAHFWGKTSPVHFFWGSFDLALTRYSGRRLEPPAGAGTIYRLGADAEQICAGFWPGHAGHPEPAMFAYAYPRPDGIERAGIEPDAAHWSDSVGEFLLPYEAIRTAADPEATITRFLQSTYRAGAELLGWSDDLTRLATDRTT